MNIGENIKKYRKEKKITQKQLSELCGIPVISIGRYERGERNPNIDILTKMATALQVPIDVLCGLKLNPILIEGEDFFLGFENKETGEISYDSMENYLQTEMAKDLVNKGLLNKIIFDQFQSIKTLLLCSGDYDLTWVIDESDVKIKLTNISNYNSSILTLDEASDLFKRIKLHIEAEMKFIEYLNKEPIDLSDNN